MAAAIAIISRISNAISAVKPDDIPILTSINSETIIEINLLWPKFQNFLSSFNKTPKMSDLPIWLKSVITFLASLDSKAVATAFTKLLSRAIPALISKIKMA